MTSHIEIEQRYQVTEAQTNEFLKRFQFVSEKCVLDVYVDTFDSLYYQKGIFIRLRNEKNLDVKFNPDHLHNTQITDHVSCAEYSFQDPFNDQDMESLKKLGMLTGLKIPNIKTIKGFFQKNQLTSFLTIKKVRKTYKVDDFEIALDLIPELDPILEIEYIGSQTINKKQEDILIEMDQLISPLGIKPLSSGSFELLLRKKNFSLYKKGKYILEEDRESNIKGF